VTRNRIEAREIDSDQENRCGVALVRVCADSAGRCRRNAAAVIGSIDSIRSGGQFYPDGAERETACAAKISAGHCAECTMDRLVAGMSGVERWSIDAGVGLWFVAGVHAARNLVSVAVVGPSGLRQPGGLQDPGRKRMACGMRIPTVRLEEGG
jgi:hypothetical protein